MTEIGDRHAIGWCHQCGTWQRLADMARAIPSWMADEPDAEAEPLCVEACEEPWGLGVWLKGMHTEACPTHAGAAQRRVTWAEDLDCTCGGYEVPAPRFPDGSDPRGR